MCRRGSSARGENVSDRVVLGPAKGSCALHNTSDRDKKAYLSGRRGLLLLLYDRWSRRQRALASTLANLLFSLRS